MWLFLWRASLLYIFPLLMWGYCRIKDIEFAELDTGVNSHKWVVLAAYLQRVAEVARAATAAGLALHHHLQGVAVFRAAAQRVFAAVAACDQVHMRAG